MTLGDSTGSTKPTTTTSDDGTITIPMDPIDLTKMGVTVDYGTLDTSNGIISGLTSGQIVKVSVTPKVNEAWIDGTKDAIEKEYTAATQSIVGITKPTLGSATEKHASTTTVMSDGHMKIAMTGIDSSKMIVAVDHGTIDTTTGVISGLKSLEKTTVSITLKAGEVWTDGTKNPVKKTYILDVPSVVSFTKPIIPWTSSDGASSATAHDAFISFPLTEMDFSKMDLTVDHGTLDTTGEYGEISGLTSGQGVTLTITLKNGAVWKDGTNGPVTRVLTAASTR